MSDNIVSTISRFLTPELIGKLASASGLERGMAQRAVDASVPAILSGLTDLASKPGGARQLADAVAEQPAGILSNLSNMLGSSAQLADKGAGLLSSLLGGGMLGTLASTVGRFIGISEGSTRTLMGLLTPVILGALGREQRAAGLEASGLARMLTAQKDQITAAMPSGLSDLLGSARRLHEGSDTARPEARTYDAPQAAYTYPRSTTAGIQRAISEPKETTLGTTWPYWVLPLLALGGLLWYFMPSGEPTRQVSESATKPVTTQQVVPTAPGKLVYLTKASDDWVPIGAYYNQDIYNRAGERIGSIKDLLVAPDGRIAAAVIGVGGFLGIGEKDVAVPLTTLQLEQRDNRRRLIIEAVKETLQAAPAFEQSGDRIRLQPAPRQ
jgi:Bacterial protein of unknown function (DUF937)/PRC-barrel domain